MSKPLNLFEHQSVRIIPKDQFHNRSENKLSELILILNPNSQGGATGKNWNNTYDKVRQFLPQHSVFFTKRANDGIHIIRDLLRKGFNNIFVIGGDGTINEAANGFFDIKPKNKPGIGFSKIKPEARLKQINSKGTLGIVPSGTRNVLARSLGISHQGIESLMHIKQMKKRTIDVVGVVVTDKNNPNLTHNRIMLNAAEMGAAAEIIDRSKKVRSKVKSRILSTAVGIVSTLPAYQSNECEVVIDRQKRITSKITIAVVANGQFLGGGFNVAPRADMSDGLLDLVIMKNSGSFKMLEKFVKMKGNDAYSQEEDILYYRASHVSILPKGRNVTVTLDGEPVGILPAVFKVYRNALSVKI